MKQSVLVIGLGRFGTAAARELMSLGHEVLVVDRDEARVNDLAPEVTHSIQADASDEDALRSLGAADFDHAIVAISGEAESSIFATMALKNLGVRNIIAKAGTAIHGSILERVGATRVVYPEREMGARVAHAFDASHIIDYLEIAPGYGIVRVAPPTGWVGRSLRELDLAARYQVTAVGLRRGTKVIVNPHRDEVLAASDELVLIGPDESIAKLENG